MSTRASFSQTSRQEREVERALEYQEGLREREREGERSNIRRGSLITFRRNLLACFFLIKVLFFLLPWFTSRIIYAFSCWIKLAKPVDRVCLCWQRRGREKIDRQAIAVAMSVAMASPQPLLLSHLAKVAITFGIFLLLSLVSITSAADDDISHHGSAPKSPSCDNTLRLVNLSPRIHIFHFQFVVCYPLITKGSLVRILLACSFTVLCLYNVSYSIWYIICALICGKKPPETPKFLHLHLQPLPIFQPKFGSKSLCG